VIRTRVGLGKSLRERQHKPLELLLKKQHPRKSPENTLALYMLDNVVQNDFSALTRQAGFSGSGLSEEAYVKQVLFLVVLVLCFDSSYAYAYLDPGTMSLVFQSIIGAIAGIAAFGSLYWRKIKSVLTGFFSKDN